eukprot:3374-Chlamydomonas_euryale.AAC.1
MASRTSMSQISARGSASPPLAAGKPAGALVDVAPSTSASCCPVHGAVVAVGRLSGRLADSDDMVAAGLLRWAAGQA